MEKLILFILATAGLSWILTKSKLFKPLREYLTGSYRDQIELVANEGLNFIRGIKLYVLYFFDSIFGCEGCMGFWSGILNYLLIAKNIDLGIFVYGFTGSIASLIIIALFNKLIRK
jgi:hypothetical protein